MIPASGKRRRRSVALALAVAAVLAAPSSSQAEPGELDPSFGTAGVVETDLGSEDIAADVTTDSSGRVIVAGRSERYEEGESEAVVVRYTPTGTLDPTFGGGDGITRFHFSGGSVDFLSAVAVDDKGRIVVAGSPDLYCTSSCAPALARLTASGQLDPNFGGGDGIVIPSGGSAALSLALDADDRILLGTGDAVYRFMESGAPDPTFDGDGVASVIGADAGLAIDGGGRVVIAEYSGIERLLASGSPDMEFGSDGLVSPGIIGDGLTHYPIALAVDAANRVIVSGVAFDSSINGSFIMQLTETGSLDPAFSGDGVITDENDAGFRDVAVDAAGRYLVTGSAPDLYSNGSVLIRLLSNGSFDPGFGNGGGFTGVPFIAEDVASDPDQRIVVAGTDGGDVNFAVARYLSDVSASPPPPQSATSSTASVTGPETKTHLGCHSARRRVARLRRKLRRTTAKQQRSRVRAQLRRAQGRAKRLC
ncbi:MAG TPA: hypothetical protein VF245_00740 [Solirubrobacterales bacterium]